MNIPSKFTIDAAGGQAHRIWGHGYIEVTPGPNGAVIRLLDDSNNEYLVDGAGGTLNIDRGTQWT